MNAFLIVLEGIILFLGAIDLVAIIAFWIYTRFFGSISIEIDFREKEK